MNKATARELQKAINSASTAPSYAAATLAGLLRSAPTKKAYVELFPSIDGLNLRAYMEVVNGVFVAKEPA